MMKRSLHAWRRLAARTTPLALLAVTAVGVSAQNAPDGKWHGGISVGGSAATGNTRSRALTVNADATQVTDGDKINLYGVVNYNTNEANGVSTKSAELYRLGGRYDHNLTEQLFLFGGGEGEANRPGGIRHRLGVNAGAGLHLVRDPTTAWDVFGGVGYTDAEFTDGSTRNGAELLFGEESSHRLGESSTVKQKLVFFPGTSDTGNRATFDASLATVIVGSWTFNTGLAVRYTSKVAPGLKKTDSLLNFGFGYKY